MDIVQEVKEVVSEVAEFVEDLLRDDSEADAPADVSLSDLLCVRHKLMAKEPRYATQTQGRSDD
ncbi:hypothetical protein C6T53_20665 [Burkholderia multivorans]|nr:hypothetical protein C6T53_20665 [Burkholderia multivorans]